MALVIEEAGTEIAESRTVDDGTAQNVATRPKREPPRPCVVLYHASVAFKGEHMITVEPPRRGAVGTDRQPYTPDLPWLSMTVTAQKSEP